MKGVLHLIQIHLINVNKFVLVRLLLVRLFFVIYYISITRNIAGKYYIKYIFKISEWSYQNMFKRKKSCKLLLIINGTDAILPVDKSLY